MKLIKTLLIAFVVTVLFSCKKSDTAKTTVEITVKDGITGTAASGASVSLYESASAVTSNTPKYTQTTDASGKAKFTVTYLSQYYVVAAKGSEKNYFSGLIPVGIFKSKADIDGSAAQTPTGVIGGVKFQDTNGDGKISAQDEVTAPAVSVTAAANSTLTTTIY